MFGAKVFELAAEDFVDWPIRFLTLEGAILDALTAGAGFCCFIGAARTCLMGGGL